MTRADALAQLGLASDATPEAIRTAYRDAARRLHPDVAGDRPENHRRMSDLNRAYAVLTSGDPDGWAAGEPTHDDGVHRHEPSSSGPATGAAGPGDLVGDVVLDADGTLLVAAPADETFDRLAEAAEQVGDLTYVDRSGGLLQLIVRHQHGPWCYVTCSLQGRATATEIFTTIESIDGQPTPPIDDVLAFLADELRATSW